MNYLVGSGDETSKPIELEEFNMIGFPHSLENLMIDTPFEGTAKKWSCPLPANMFSHMSNLRRLYIHNSDLKNFDRHSFSPLTQLRIFQIEECCNCSHLDFAALPHLEWLGFVDLKGEFPASLCLINRENFRRLEINRFKHEESSITNILKEFSHPNLTVLDLKLGKLCLDKNWLEEFPSLRALRVKYCELERFEIPAMPHLELLSLVLNRIKSFDGLNFAGLANLKSLDLKWNELKLVQADIFKGLERLCELNVSTNQLESIHEDAFRGLVDLKRLDLSHNKLEWLHPDLFGAHLANLIYLDLSNNRLKEVNLTGLGNLEVLNLSSNKLSSMVILKDLIELRKLLLSSNLIENIDTSAFACATKLEQVNIRNNKISRARLEELQEKFLSVKILF